MDALYILATSSSSIALTNLISSNYTITVNGTPTFTADGGYTGTDGGTSQANFLDTGFNPATATSPNFTQNSAHIAAWSNTNAASGPSGGAIIGAYTTGSVETDILPRYTSNNFFGRINDATASAGTANSDSRGLFSANRSGSSVSQKYLNGALFASPNAASAAVPNRNIYILGVNKGAGADLCTAYQIMAASIGGSMSAAQHLTYNNALRKYIQTIFGPLSY